jgi:hypothetical protein
MPSVSVHLAINIVVVLILCEKLTAGEVEPLLTCAPLTATMFYCLLRDGVKQGCILLNAFIARNMYYILYRLTGRYVIQHCVHLPRHCVLGQHVVDAESSQSFDKYFWRYLGG